MQNILASIIAPFNPFAFAAVFSLGIIILVRTPERLLKVGATLPAIGALRSHHRRGA